MCHLVNTNTQLTYTLGSVAAEPDNLEDGKEAGRKTQGTQGVRKICSSRENVCPLSRVMRCLHSRHHWSPLGRIKSNGIDRMSIIGWQGRITYTVVCNLIKAVSAHKCKECFSSFVHRETAGASGLRSNAVPARPNGRFQGVHLYPGAQSVYRTSLLFNDVFSGSSAARASRVVGGWRS